MLENQILTLAKNMSPIRSIAKEMVLANEDWRQIVEIGEVGATWTDELSDREDDETPDLSQIGLFFGEMKSHLWTTHKALHATIIDEGWLVDGISKKFARAEGLAFVGGNGVNQPKGFLSSPAPVATADEPRAFGTLQFYASGAAGGLGSAPVDVLYRAFYGLKGAYRANAQLGDELGDDVRARHHQGRERPVYGEPVGLVRREGQAAELRRDLRGGHAGGSRPTPSRSRSATSRRDTASPTSPG